MELIEFAITKDQLVQLRQIELDIFSIGLSSSPKKMVRVLLSWAINNFDKHATEEDIAPHRNIYFEDNLKSQAQLLRLQSNNTKEV